MLYYVQHEPAGTLPRTAGTQKKPVAETTDFLKLSSY